LNVAPPALMSQDATLSICGVSSRRDSAREQNPSVLRAPLALFKTAQ